MDQLKFDHRAAKGGERERDKHQIKCLKQKQAKNVKLLKFYHFDLDYS